MTLVWIPDSTATQSVSPNVQPPINRLTLIVTMLERMAYLYQVEFLVTETRWWFFLPMWQKYKSACEENQWEAVERSKFYNLWSELSPRISISTPSSDLCFMCEQNTLAIQKSGCLSREENSERLESAQEHLRRAKTERDYYNSQVEAAENAEKKTSSSRIAHYSYDFAQQIHFPYDSQQTGPEYFKTARKRGLFGVTMESGRWCYILSTKPKTQERELCH